MPAGPLPSASDLRTLTPAELALASSRSLWHPRHLPAVLAAGPVAGRRYH